MKKISCVIADDETLAREILENYITQLDHLHLVAACADGTEAYNVIRANKVDLLFLDINMPRLSGIALLRTLQDPPVVIFTTAHREFALEGYELNAIDYLLKPVSFERFLKAVNKFEELTQKAGKEFQAVGEKQQNEEAFIYVKVDKKMVRVLLQDILYIEGLKDYVKIHTTKKTIMTYQTLMHFEENLPADKFIRIHRSYIISTSHIDSYAASEIDIHGHMIPIGISYQKEVLQRLGGIQ
jgi:DNA-binding LytR/AlgR family response regulator